VSVAARRQETRGSHWREDFPATDDARWRVRQVVTIGDLGPEVSELAVEAAQ
jgi:L-aspartate oxidase